MWSEAQLADPDSEGTLEFTDSTSFPGCLHMCSLVFEVWGTSSQHEVFSCVIAFLFHNLDEALSPSLIIYTMCYEMWPCLTDISHRCTSILVHFQEPLLRSIILQINSWGTLHHIFLQQVTNKHTPSLGCSTKALNGVDPAYLPLQLISISDSASMTTTPACFQFRKSQLPHGTFAAPSAPRHFPMSPALTLFTHRHMYTCTHTLPTPTDSPGYQLNVIYSSRAFLGPESKLGSPITMPHKVYFFCWTYHCLKIFIYSGGLVWKFSPCWIIVGSIKVGWISHLPV